MSDDEHSPKAPSANVPLKGIFTAHESSFDGANDEGVHRRLSLLEAEHSDLDAAIKAMETSAYQDRLAIARIKKRKLQLKDLIKRIRDKIIPDIIA